MTGHKTGETVTVDFTTASPSTGAAADADSTPTGTLVLNGTDDGATVTVTNKATGVYKAAVTLPTVTDGDELQIRIAATVSTVAGKAVVWTGAGVTERAADLNDLNAAGIRAAVGLASANLDTQLSTIDTVVDSILVDTGTDIPASLTTIDDFLDTEIAAIKAKTDNLPAAPAATGDIPSAATIASQVRTELTTELGRIDAAVSTRLATASYTAAPTAIQNADAILARAVSNVEGSADRHSLAAMVMIGTNSSISGTTLTAKKPSDDTTFATYTLTAAAGADPIGGIA